MKSLVLFTIVTGSILLVAAKWNLDDPTVETSIQFSTGTFSEILAQARREGKVIFMDIYATWCGPCVAEVPSLKKAYDAYHAKGFEIIGISLDDKREALLEFTKKNGMAWPQYFDGEVWKNKLAVKYGVNSIPATYLLDREGKIIGKDLRGEELEQAVAAALSKK